MAAAFILFGNPMDMFHFKNVINPLKTKEEERERERERGREETGRGGLQWGAH
jgi:hypothetical protein